MRRIGKLFGVGLLGLVVTGMTLWGMGALYYAPLPTPLRGVLAAAFGLATARGVSGPVAPPPHAPGLRAGVGCPGRLVEHHHPLQRP